MNLGRLDLNLLMALEALIDEAHVTRAAQRVSISQPAISDALHRLRQLLGDELLVQLAEGIVQRRDKFDPRTDSRTFNVVQPLLMRIAQEAPGVSLRLVQANPGIRSRAPLAPFVAARGRGQPLTRGARHRKCDASHQNNRFSRHALAHI